MRAYVQQLRSVAIAALRRMYLPSERLFCFCLRRQPDGSVAVEGVSRRYTAIVLLGLAGEDESVARQIFGDISSRDVCADLIKASSGWTNLGDVALTLWAARLLNHDDAPAALKRLKELDPVSGPHPTVEVAWSLSALAATGGGPRNDSLAQAIAGRLLRSFNPATGLFPHQPPGVAAAWHRSHVTCFADFVYPVQALSFYGALTHQREALDAAQAGAERACLLQGPAGQWWWHFDVRTGRVVEGYPVYAVHQNSMAPMALFAAQEACGADYRPSIVRGLEWLRESPEINSSLLDRDAGIIWRKVARREPNKLSRGVQALASRLIPSLRVPGVGRIFPPDRVDYESRPYHMGWILYAWSAGRISCLPFEGEEQKRGRAQGSLAGPSFVRGAH